jgi:hypothetical protein
VDNAEAAKQLFEYSAKLQAMSDEELRAECRRVFPDRKFRKRSEARQTLYQHLSRTLVNEIEQAKRATEEAGTPAWVVFIVVALVILGAIFVCGNIFSGSNYSPSDDPYYDAPRGRTRGGDSF